VVSIHVIESLKTNVIVFVL